ncbi:radical SAM protein [Geodermatophilus sp. SYSU D01180]
MKSQPVDLTLQTSRPPLPQLTESLPAFQQAGPDCVTILPTYQCNAACAECCFESSPRIRHRMTPEDLLQAIQRVADELPSVRYIVFSGGEVTLLRHGLLDAIRLATRLGLATRIVSNGHWGRSDESAARWARDLREAGLQEMNFSTGDEHQMFVPFDSVARAALHSVRNGLITLITVEGKDGARFTDRELREHPAIATIRADPELCGRFLMMTNVWMPFHADADVTNDSVDGCTTGCDNVLENFVINPYGALMSCCGLTMEYIPEMKVGHLDSGESLRETYVDQYRDLLKLWIWLDGTEKIFSEAVDRGSLDRSKISPHMCATCAQIYRDPEVRTIVDSLVRENREAILFRAVLKARMTGRIPRELTKAAAEAAGMSSAERKVDGHS